MSPNIIHAVLGAVACCFAASSGRADTFYVSNYGDSTIKKVSSSGAVTNFAMVPGKPYGLAFDSRGYLYVASAQTTNLLSSISPDGTVTRFATLPPNFDATDILFDSHGTMHLTDQSGYGVGRMLITGGTVSRFATNRINLSFGLAFNPRGNLYVGDNLNSKIVSIQPDGKAGPAILNIPSVWGLAFDASGDLYASTPSVIKRIPVAGAVTNFSSGFTFASGIAFDSRGDLYVVDQSKNTIRRVTPDGVAHAFATGLNQPLYIAVRPDSTVPRLSIPKQSTAEIGQSGATLSLSGGINQFYQLFTSPNLTNWTVWQTNVLRATNAVEINDPEAANLGRRFYRAVLVP